VEEWAGSAPEPAHAACLEATGDGEVDGLLHRAGGGERDDPVVLDPASVRGDIADDGGELAGPIGVDRCRLGCPAGEELAEALGVARLGDG